MMKRMEQDMRAKKQPEPWKQLNKAHKTNIDWLEARINRTMASLRAAVALGTSIAAQVDLRNAQIVRLKRQLRVTKRPKKSRRGWSTTRARFSLPE